MKKKNQIAEEIQRIQTSHGELQFYRDLDSGGCIVMLNPQTIKRYLQLQEESRTINLSDFDVFVAFTEAQYEVGLNSIRPLKDGEKIYRIPGGGFGTHDGIGRLCKYYESQHDKIKKECEPQEVYFEEYNNHECMIAFDGDLEAIKIVIDIFGAEAARNVLRFNIYNTIDEI